jgi:general secretion pathway protein A
MTLQWLVHFGLQSPPFSKENRGDRLVAPLVQGSRSIDGLVDACTERRHVLLTGEPGVGKPCIPRALKTALA